MVTTERVNYRAVLRRPLEPARYRLVGVVNSTQQSSMAVGRMTTL